MSLPRPESAIDLNDFAAVEAHQWIMDIVKQFDRQVRVAECARIQLVQDLERLNAAYGREHQRSIFTSVEGRVKSRQSFLKKLPARCMSRTRRRGFTQETVRRAYAEIVDLRGVRFSCPYYDQVKWAVDELVRPRLASLGYATDLRSQSKYRDRDVLDTGNEFGYRSYHFFVRVPTVVDIFGKVEPFPCEVQARTELEHVWATKSHDLLYKPREGWDFSDPHVVEDMRQISNNLRAVDQHLVSIRDRARGGTGHGHES